MEWSIGDADQAIDGQIEAFQNAANLAVLTFTQSDGQPDVRPLDTVERRLDRTVAHAIDLDPVCERVEPILIHHPERANAVAPQQPSRRQLKVARKRTARRQQQQAFGIGVQAADRDDARQVGRERLEDRFAALGITVGRHKSLGLVIAPQPDLTGLWERLAIDEHLIGCRNERSRLADNAAVEFDPALSDPAFGVAPRTEASA